MTTLTLIQEYLNTKLQSLDKLPVIRNTNLESAFTVNIHRAALLYYCNDHGVNFNISLNCDTIEIRHWIRGQTISEQLPSIALASPSALDTLFDLIKNTK